MIDAEHIIKLLEAGYTKEEIDKMGAGDQSAGKSETKEVSGDNDDGAEKSEGNDTEDAGTITKEDLDPFRVEIDELKKTIKALQEQNTKNSTFTPPDEAKTIVEDLSKNF